MSPLLFLRFGCCIVYVALILTYISLPCMWYDTDAGRPNMAFTLGHKGFSFKLLEKYKLFTIIIFTVK